MSRALAWRAALLAAAFWPVWIWLARRIGTDADERGGLLALAAALAIGVRFASAEAPTLLPAALALFYAAACPFAPPLLRGALAVAALVSLVAPDPRRPGALALWGLALLALPVVSSLQFFLGWPLRVTVATLAAALLRLTGAPVVRDGAALAWGDRVVAVDAPCSGVHFLWTALALAFALAAVRRLPAGRTALAALAAVAIAVAANVMRAAALFYPEAGLVRLPAPGHTFVGVLAFVLVAVALERACRPAREVRA